MYNGFAPSLCYNQSILLSVTSILWGKCITIATSSHGGLKMLWGGVLLIIVAVLFIIKLPGSPIHTYIRISQIEFKWNLLLAEENCCLSIIYQIVDVPNLLLKKKGAPLFSHCEYYLDIYLRSSNNPCTVFIQAYTLAVQRVLIKIKDRSLVWL